MENVGVFSADNGTWQPSHLSTQELSFFRSLFHTIEFNILHLYGCY